jgi:hypothetical protein
MRGRVLLCFFVALLAACGGDEDESEEEDLEAEQDAIMEPVPGSAIRVGEPQTDRDSQSPYHIRILATEEDCRSARIASENYEQCLPRVDRASGEIQLGFRFEMESGDGYPMPDITDRLQVFHQGTGVEDERQGRRVEVVPHDPEQARNLYILLIDSSSSMTTPYTENPNEKTRMEKLRSALLRRDVVHTFYPEESTGAGVVLLQFSKPSGSQSLVTPVGKTLKILESRQAYREAVKSMQNRGGYTPLYAAIERTMDMVQDEPVIKDSLSEDSAVTIIALSDGFNNLLQSDTCSSNVGPLNALLEKIEITRDDEDIDLNQKPTIFTVGLGQPLYAGFSTRTQASGGAELKKVNRRNLCGSYQRKRIDGDIERLGIDNASLAWIAEAGGGSSFVSNSEKGLADAFRRAAAVRYSWFEVRYDHDPLYMRRRFKTTLQLSGQYSVRSWVKITPSSWFDGPPGVTDATGWTRPRSFIYTLAIFVPLLSLFLVLSYWGVVGLNIRRGLLGRIRRGRLRSSEENQMIARGPLPPAPPPPSGA